MVEHSPKILTTNTSEEKATTIQVMSLPVFFSPARMFSIIALKCALTSQSNVDY